MCEKVLLTEDKRCLKETIKLVCKSIDKGEKKLRKLFNKENDTNSN